MKFRAGILTFVIPRGLDTEDVVGRGGMKKSRGPGVESNLGQRR